MNKSFMGFMENTITFECDETVKAGVPVKVVESGKVTACAEGDKICGVCVNVRDSFASVQVAGFVTLACDGEVSCGFTNVSATAEGKVKADETGRQVLVITADENTAGFIL
ncbi:MAG: hypothetical protein IJD93_06320 [Ruminococcus sp.]|nr:hypothetical protein [Ruminococcus sp.]